MATKKQQQELIDVLKFTPTKIQILIQGYGGETYAGIVDRKIYEYFKAQKIDLNEYASSWDEFESMPKEMQPFMPGSPYECDSMFHASGAELSNLNTITVYEVDSGKELWEHNMGWDELEEAGVTVHEFSNVSFEDDLEDGEVAFWGGQGEKGCFFDGEVTLTAPFDPKKLKVTFENCDGWCIVNYIEYDGEDVDGSGGYSTTGKWGENKWIIGGDEEVYDDVVPVDEREDEGLTWDMHMPEWDPAAELEKIAVPKEEFDWSPLEEPAVTEWFSKDIKPTIKGTYEAVIDAAWPLSGIRMVEWTGRSWKENGEKVAIKEWRGLAEDPAK